MGGEGGLLVLASCRRLLFCDSQLLFFLSAVVGVSAAVVCFVVWWCFLFSFLIEPCSGSSFVIVFFARCVHLVLGVFCAINKILAVSNKNKKWLVSFQILPGISLDHDIENL